MPDKFYYIKNFVLLEENNREAIAGPNPPVTDIYKIVQTGINQGNIQTYQELDYKLILTDQTVGDTRIYAKYLNQEPVVTLSGTNKESISIQFIERPISIIVQGTSDNVSNGNRTITFRGNIPGNTSSSHIVTPTITKIASTLNGFGNPSPTNPYSVDQDNNPSIDVIGVGNTVNPSLTLRFGNLSFPNHILQFNW